MEDNKMKDNAVSYYTMEAMLAREERLIWRLLILLLISVVMLFASNALWLYAWNQYDYSGRETVTVDGKNGIASYIGNDGEIVNGESSRDSQTVETEEESEVEGYASEEE